MPEGIWWTSSGEGPAVVVPRLNVDWTAVDLSPLTDRFRVVIVSPRGFGPSERPGGYAMSGFVADIEQVLDHLDVDSYTAFGYSMNGVMAVRLALSSPRVVAVACGGFPLTADLAGMGDRARARNEAARHDPDAWAEVLATYDPVAAEAFWDDVAALPRNALADLDRPLRTWWGEEDALVASFLSPAELRSDLDARGIPYEAVPGLDHDGMLRRLDLVLPSVVDWLAVHLD
ncbi:alpha/beta fold hydrolase [Aeromicrobium tamlense]|uniref:Alpha/beta fold hydrolase n=1 Tax=Aeromicrobium tamlense TaxID=375541 RepID=A0A8I0KHP6_9ACTN|nr:alpha/beta hydrolase [Aeromicrobium tamlense]MBD1270692.1 alpha/beta fold hydrolase [Aeromicrobium tamlense]MBD1271176.1 alpha/beta fold hydrolase [Aeromicrobium tamlense]NYI38082.1 pimeloyl-ACP methyl ester carboxylesterase [Aeromicrobium tamlense]